VSKLTEKGLVTSLIKNNKKYFKPVSPQKLIDLIEEKKEELEEKKEELTTQTLPFLNKLYKIKEPFMVSLIKNHKTLYGKPLMEMVK